ncbi:hypothetical protein Dxin01_00113 [Deinococcus xinjiangensis]|uniref:Uncharacterized protein n=1 Tax=Deinococcus xinjiangensis TaxID=457454 RepID=A0ABP9V9M6_9DEIO
MNMSGLLANMASSSVIDAVTDKATRFARHPKTQANILRAGAWSAGQGAAKAEYVARALRRTEAVLNQRADQVERGVTPDQPVWQVVRDCWRE